MIWLFWVQGFRGLGFKGVGSRVNKRVLKLGVNFWFNGVMSEKGKLKRN